MATASVGKTTAGQTDDNNSLCDACEDHTASKYCLVCPGPLCDNCTKSHRKSKLTKDHKLCDLPLSRLGSSYIRSGEPPEGLRKCPKHQDKEMDHFCGNCICFVCTSCKGEHSGHKTYLAREDISAHRTVYNNHMKRLLDESHDLEQYKINLEKIIQNYEETCTEVEKKADHLITEIKDNADRLKGELRTVQGEFKKLLGDAENGLIKEIKYTDDQISKFQGFRKTDDCDVISHALASSEEVLNKLSDYKKEITPMVRTPPTKKILPYEKEIDSIKDYVRRYFVMDTPFTLTISADMSKTNTRYIKYPKGEAGYRFCRSQTVKDNLIIYGTFTDNIRLLDKNYAEKEQITYETNIWNMVTVSNDKHVVLRRWDDWEISLLDENFKVISKQSPSPKQQIRAICYYGPNQFVMCETGDAAYFSIVLVKNKTFVKQSEITISGFGGVDYMELYPDKQHCLAGTGMTLYKVNLTKSTFTKHDVSAFIQEIWSLFVDGHGNALIGDEKGNVHKFDEMMNHELITNIGHPVRDILVKEDRLLVSSRDNKIYEYL